METRRNMGALRTVSSSVAAILVLSAALMVGGGAFAPAAPVKPPESLRDTGLFSDFESLEVDPTHLAFSPQYPLWTDGAAKRRWISLPPGTAIDGSDPEAWVFPVGTRFWKEFSFGGRRIETRYLERLSDETWLYAAYEWGQDGREALLAPERGRRGAFPLEGGRSHTIPGISDCKVCHQAGRGEVLGFSALQLSPDRDPDALHSETAGVDLDDLVEAGLLVGLPDWMRKAPPRIEARTAIERVALGYLHGNCGHCHNDQGPLRTIGLYLRHVAGTPVEPAIATAVGRPVRKPAPGQSPEAVLRIEPKHPERSALAERLASRYAALQMPPLGTELVDREAAALIVQWIAELETSRPEAKE